MVNCLTRKLENQDLNMVELCHRHAITLLLLNINTITHRLPHSYFLNGASSIAFVENVFALLYFYYSHLLLIPRTPRIRRLKSLLLLRLSLSLPNTRCFFLEFRETLEVPSMDTAAFSLLENTTAVFFSLTHLQILLSRL